MTDRPKAWMPLYVGDYLTGTAHLSAAESGAYLHLILHYWNNGGPLPADDEQLRRLSRMERDEWAASKGRVLAFFVIEGDRLIHGRVDAEIAKATEVYEGRKARAEAARAAREAKAASVNSNIRTDVSPDMPTQSQSQSQSQSPVVRVPPSAARTGEVSKPDDSAAEPPPLKTKLFGECLQWLGRAAGKDPNRLRSVVGGWCRDYGEEPVLRAFLRAQRDGPVEPVAWITAALKTEKGPLNGNRNRRSAAQSPEDRDRAIRAEVFAGAYGDVAGGGRADFASGEAGDFGDPAEAARVVGSGRA